MGTPYSTKSFFLAAVIEELTGKAPDRLLFIPEQKLVMFSWVERPEVVAPFAGVKLIVNGKEYPIDLFRLEARYKRLRREARKVLSEGKETRDEGTKAD